MELFILLWFQYDVCLSHNIVNYVLPNIYAYTNFNSLMDYKSVHMRNLELHFLLLRTSSSSTFFESGRGTPEALYYRRFLHGVHLPANQRRLPPLPTDPIGWDVYAM